LELSQLELENAINTELMENPALEKLEDFEEAISLEEIYRAVAPCELKPSGGDHELRRSLPNDSEQDVDWLDLASSDDSLWDHLLAQLRITLPERMTPLMVYLVGSINDRGYLTCTVEEAALDCGASLEDAETVLMALKNCEPAGVGACDLRECLILQLRDALTDAEKLARVMLRRNWDDLVARNTRAIQRSYGLPESLVQEAFDVILSLNPFPGEGFISNAAAGSNRDKPFSTKPDVVIIMDQAGFIVEVPGPNQICLRVNPAYEKRRKEVGQKLADAAEKRHLTEFCDRAHRFLDALTQRRIQLARIGRYLVEFQSGFVRTGESMFLVPLTRTQMAKDLGVHESTISRATNGKFVQLVTGDVVSFDLFFKPALRVQKMIEEILATENPDSPFSDERIAKMLESRGVKVARRTVNKYRDRSKMLSSRMRKAS
jgi:RNA polymerase sigma-54 factor